MFTITVAPTLLFNRLNAEANAPELVKNARIIEQSGINLKALGDLVTAPINNSIRDISGELDNPNGTVPMFRPADIDGFFLDSDKAPKLSSAFEQEHEKSRVHPGDIVLAVAGTVAAAGRVPSWVKYGNVNGSCARIKPKAALDGYLLAYLNSAYGFRSLMRLAVGSVQKHLNLEDLPEVIIAMPVDKALRQIGQKIFQVDLLKAQSRRLESELNCFLNKVVPSYDEIPKMCSRVSSTLLGNRVDNQPYRTHFLSLIQAVISVKHNQVHSIAEVTGGDPVPSELFGPKGIPLVRIRDISPQGFSRPEAFVPPAYAAENSYSSAQEGWIVVGMDGEFRAQFFLKEELPQFINQRVAIIRTHSMRPELLTFWLNRTEGQMQLNRWTTQTTVGHIRLDDIRTLLVPRLEESVENELADKLLSARRSNWYAQALALAAKLLVEALIEGKLTEQEFVTAQEALECGDNSADRALLSRLTLEGIDVPDQPPLFPDLDALYALLAQIVAVTD